MVFFKGRIKEKLSNQTTFVVQFDKPVIVEDISHMILKDDKNKNIRLEVDDCVLAKNDNFYCLGSIIEKEGINYTIQFYDGKM